MERSGAGWGRALGCREVWCMCAVVGVGGSDPPFIFQNVLLYNVLSVISWLESI